MGKERDKEEGREGGEEEGRRRWKSKGRKERKLKSASIKGPLKGQPLAPGLGVEKERCSSFWFLPRSISGHARGGGQKEAAVTPLAGTWQL